MSTVATPAPPSELLARLQALPPVEDPWWVRLRRAAPVTVAVALAGASFTVVAVAYLVGGAGRTDLVRPGFEEYAAEFFGPTPTAVTASFVSVPPEQLDAQGWPCHESLAGDLRRTAAGYDQVDGVVTVTYTDGTHRLTLYEQPGRLDRSRLDGFERRTFDDTSVWVRGSGTGPLVVTWDRDGIVYTVVTDVAPGLLARAVSELPEHEDPSTWERIGTGLDRMTDWVAAA